MRILISKLCSVQRILVNHVKITVITLTEYMDLSFCGYHPQNDFFMDLIQIRYDKVNKN